VSNIASGNNTLQSYTPYTTFVKRPPTK